MSRSTAAVRIADAAPVRKPARKPSKSVAKTVAKLPARRQAAIGLALIAVALLVLSLWHCTTALVLLTGSPVVLAACMAIGIDGGLIGCEIAAIAGKGTAGAKWAKAYIVLAVLLSMGLNALGNSVHAPAEYYYAAIGLGLVVPVLIFILGQAVGLLWDQR